MAIKPAFQLHRLVSNLGPVDLFCWGLLVAAGVLTFGFAPLAVPPPKSAVAEWTALLFSVAAIVTPVVTIGRMVLDRKQLWEEVNKLRAENDILKASGKRNTSAIAEHQAIQGVENVSARAATEVIRAAGQINTDEREHRSVEEAHKPLETEDKT